MQKGPARAGPFCISVKCICDPRSPRERLTLSANGWRERNGFDQEVYLDQALSLATRADRRDTLREAVFL